MNDHIATPWLLFDLDGTCTSQQLLVCMLEGLAPKYPQVAQMLEEAAPLYERYKQREAPYEPYIHEIVKRFFDGKLYTGIRQTDAVEAAKIAGRRCRSRMYAFLRELLGTAKEHGFKLAAISGSPKEAAQAFLEPFDVDKIFATEFSVSADGLFTGDSVSEFVTNKERAIDLLEQEFGLIDTTRSIAIDDTVSGACLFRRVKYPICFKPKGRLMEQAIQHKWSIVLEEPDVHVFLGFDERGERQWRKSLIGMLPPELASSLHQRLESAGW